MTDVVGHCSLHGFFDGACEDCEREARKPKAFRIFRRPGNETLAHVEATSAPEALARYLVAQGKGNALDVSDDIGADRVFGGIDHA